MRCVVTMSVEYYIPGESLDFTLCLGDRVSILHILGFLVRWYVGFGWKKCRSRQSVAWVINVEHDYVLDFQLGSNFEDQIFS